MPWSEAMEKKIRSIQAEYPLVYAGLTQALSGLNREDAQYLKALYAGLCIQDLVSLQPDTALGYVQAAQAARRELPYAADVPEALFLQYVLPPWVNNEFLDGSRGVLSSQLIERVKNKGMLDAALEVNYWCYEKATYLPSDDRTIGPLGICRRTRGRCGEESTLLVSALRSVCIPARQCYAPFWAHCDDNHAWVEFWAEGQWHYMGACEPEPVPDAGWFTSAASRAMLVRSFAPDFTSERGRRMVNTTAQYARTALLHVHVSASGMPCGGVLVRFQLVNDCQLKTLYEASTDAEGQVSLETGLGFLVVSAYMHGRLIEQLADVRQTRDISLRWEDGFDPMTEEQSSVWELVPPKEEISEIPPENTAHQSRLRQCEASRTRYEMTFSTAPWLALARGNQTEIAQFLSLESFSWEDKELLLSTLSEKDFADVSCETLQSFLSAALPWKEQYPLSTWRDEILAPRVEHEPLLPIRQFLHASLSGAALSSAQAVLAWMETHLRRVDERGAEDRRGNAASYILHGICPQSEWDILAVQLCRALGIPARLYPITGRFLPSRPAAVRLTLCASPSAMVEKTQFTLAQWQENRYRTLNLDGLSISGKAVLSLCPGSYSLITCRRQIDGTASVRALRFVLSGDRTVPLSLAPDRTAEKLQAVSLPAAENLPAAKGKAALLLFIHPDAEPTEHLLQELLELQERYRQGAWPIRFLLSGMEEAENPTLCRVLSALPDSRCLMYKKGWRFEVQRAMGLGDSRLPLSVVLDKYGRGVYASANYQIHSAHTLLRVLELL